MTTQTKHTGGTWEWVSGGNTPFVQVKGRFPHGFICNVESLNPVEDAKLIAAAPFLLAALKKLANEVSAQSNDYVHLWVMNIADDAIKGFEDE